MPEGAGKVVVILTVWQEAVDVMLHEFVAVTQMLPFKVPEVTTILFVL
jgi:hypothetical protein